MSVRRLKESMWKVSWHVKDNSATYAHWDEMLVEAGSEEEALQAADERIVDEFDYGLSDVERMWATPYPDNARYKYAENKTRKSRSRHVNEDFENRAWAVWEYNDADAEFGYDPGAHVVEGNLTREYAEQRAEELEAQNPHEFIHYYADQEPMRWT